MSSDKSKFLVKIAIFLFLGLLGTPVSTCFSQSLLVDQNGDGTIKVLAFGDSITYGIGDGGVEAGQPKGGYPQRLATIVGVPVANDGVPGEILATEGVGRFVGSVRNANPDIVLVTEGANDARSLISNTAYRSALQRLINATRYLGKNIVLGTLPEPCCEHSGQAGRSNDLSEEVKTLAEVNEISTADFQKAWETTCKNKNECELYNLPEGLHPNAKGYTVMAQTAAATLANINIFAPGGAAELEGAFGLSLGSVLVKPEASPVK